MLVAKHDNIVGMTALGPELKVRRQRAMSGLDPKADNPKPIRRTSSEPIVEKAIANAKS